MKKLLSLFFCFSIIFTVVSCAKEEGAKPTGGTDDPDIVLTPEPEVLPSRPLSISQVVYVDNKGIILAISGEAKVAGEVPSGEEDTSQWFLDGVSMLHQSSGTANVYYEKGQNRIAANIDNSTLINMPNLSAAAVGEEVSVVLSLKIVSSEEEVLLNKNCAVKLLRADPISSSSIEEFSCP